MRSFIRAVKENSLKKDGIIEQGKDLDDWLEWATDQADRLDPLVESPYSILDEKDDYLLV